MTNTDPTLNEISLIWEHRSRIVALETNYKHVSDTVEKIDKNVNTIMDDHLPLIKESVNKNKWTVGIVVGLASIIGSSLVSSMIGHLWQ